MTGVTADVPCVEDAASEVVEIDGAAAITTEGVPEDAAVPAFAFANVSVVDVPAGAIIMPLAAGLCPPAGPYSEISSRFSEAYACEMSVPGSQVPFPNIVIPAIASAMTEALSRLRLRFCAPVGILLIALFCCKPL